MDQKELENMIKNIVSSLEETPETPKSNNDEKKFTYKDYPLGEKSIDKLFTPTGKNITEITLEDVMSGKITAADVRIRPETLEMQAQVAESRNRNVFASNLRRAAELIEVPDEKILKIYDSLRPYRSTKAELIAIAEDLENNYGCVITSKLVREAADVGELRGRLKKA